MRVPKILSKILVSVVVLLVLFVAGGVIYVMMVDRSSAEHTPVAKTDKPVTTSLPKPVQPSPNAPEGVGLESITDQATAGTNVSMIIITNAGSTCTISVSYNGHRSSDSGLAPKTADAYGTVTWSWTVDSSAPVGNWPIEVTCAYHGRTGVLQSSIKVTQ